MSAWLLHILLGALGVHVFIDLLQDIRDEQEKEHDNQ